MRRSKKPKTTKADIPKPEAAPKLLIYPKPKEKPKVKTIIDIVGFASGRKIGYKEGFSSGIHHIVFLAEENLNKSLKLKDRNALVNSGQIPAWWVATLVEEYGTKRLPDDIYMPGDI